MDIPKIESRDAFDFTNEVSKDFLEELGVNRKAGVTHFIRKNFREGVDFIITKKSELRGSGGHNESVFMLTNDTMELVRSTYNMKHKYVKKVRDTAIKCIVMSVENSTIGFICNATRPLFTNMIRQYKVGKYRVDLYIPDIKLCVECDEEGHREYNASLEKERQGFIEKELSCCFIRFNPNADGFDVSDVIAEILKMYKNAQ